jgi:hypothetical protein
MEKYQTIALLNLEMICADLFCDRTEHESFLEKSDMFKLGGIPILQK